MTIPGKEKGRCSVPKRFICPDLSPGTDLLPGLVVVLVDLSGGKWFLMRFHALRACTAFCEPSFLGLGHGYSVFGGDIFVFIARDEDDLVFVSCQVTQNGGRGFPEDDADRVALERLAAAYLAEHLVFGDVLVRFDVVSMLIVGESRALF